MNFISSRPHIRAKQLAEIKALKRRQIASKAFELIKWVLGYLLLMLGLWAFVWLFYFAFV